MLMGLAVYAVVPGRTVRVGRSGDAQEDFSVTWRFRSGIWLAFFCTTYVAYGCTAWVPTLTTMNHLPLQAGLDAMFWFNLLAMAGVASGGFLLTRFGSRRLLTGMALLAGAGVGVLFVGMGPGGGAVATSLPVATAIIGGATAMLLATMYVVLAQGYPVARRAAGVGVGMLLGRFGGIASSWFGGSLLGATVADSAPFHVSLLCAVAGIVAGLSIIDRHVPGDRP
jgi:MFS family permease